MGRMEKGQKQISLNEGWKFHLGDIPEAWYRGYDDSAWEDVFLPHDWSVHLPFEKEYSSGTGYLAGGVGWYRVRFRLPEEARGKCVRVVFDGIYKNSRIWCNSYHLGKRPYGYTEISYDLTGLVHFGGQDNEISVRVCHTDLADSRWFTGSGITREARILIEEPVHCALHGTVMETIDVDEDDDGVADIRLRSELVNQSGREKKVWVRWRLDEANGKNAVCVFRSKPVILPAQKPEDEEPVTVTVTEIAGVNVPKLWSDKTPVLYTLTTELSENWMDWYAVETDRVGIRTFRFDANRGFFLNGKPMKLKGVCVHHDGGCLGAAMYREVWERRLLKLKAAGCNAIRTSHNPHMPALYDLCDELGMLMMDEAFDEWENPKNKWSTGHNVYPPKHEGYAEDFPQWHKADLTDMIRRDRSHPSIVLWSIGNEIDYPNDPYCHPSFGAMTGNNDANKPAAERQYSDDRPDASRLAVWANRLAAIVKSADTTRPVTLAAAFPELSSTLGFLEPLDVVGYNYKEQFYEQDHSRFPDKPFLGSENSHSYEAWKAVTDHDYISGQFLWTGIDYLGEAKGWPVRGSGAGILDLAGNEKPGYWRRKAFWSEETGVYLLTAKAPESAPGEWLDYRGSWEYQPGDLVVVRCFVSHPETQKTKELQCQLYLNGILQGAGTHRPEYGCIEWVLTYQPGTLEVKVKQEEASLEPDCSCVLRTPGAVQSIRAKIWKREEETGKPGGAEAPETGTWPENAVLQAEISLRDKDGLLVTGDDREIRVSVEGGTLLGLENGCLSDLTCYASSSRKTFGGRLIAYIRPERSKAEPRVRISVSCESLGEKRVLEA